MTAKEQPLDYDDLRNAMAVLKHRTALDVRRSFEALRKVTDQGRLVKPATPTSMRPYVTSASDRELLPSWSRRRSLRGHRPPISSTETHIRQTELSSSMRQPHLRFSSARRLRQRPSVGALFETDNVNSPTRSIDISDRALVGSIGGSYGENPYAQNNTNSTSANEHEVSNAVWIGLAVGATIVVLLIAGCLFWCCRESSKQRALEAEAMSKQGGGRSQQLSRAGSVRSVQSRDSNPRRRDYRNSMRASIVNDPQEIFRESVRSFSKRFTHADLAHDVDDQNDDDTEEIYFQGVKCPRRPSGERNALHDLYYGRPTLKQTQSARNTMSKSSTSKQQPVIVPGKARPQSLVAGPTVRLASTPEKPRRKSDYGASEASRATISQTSPIPDSQVEAAAVAADKPISEQAPALERDESIAPSKSAATQIPGVVAEEHASKVSKRKLRETEDSSDTETTFDLSLTMDVSEKSVPAESSDIGGKVSRHHHGEHSGEHKHHHHEGVKAKKKSKKPKSVSNAEMNASSDVPGAVKSDEAHQDVRVTQENSQSETSEADRVEEAPKKKKSSSKKKKTKKSKDLASSEAERRPSRVDVL